MGNVTILVGAQWGDEGKGKWIDVMAQEADLVVRYQGGNNAGHTLYVDGEKIVLHQLPSGIFHDHQRSALAAGVVINPAELVSEIKKVSHRATVEPERLWLSSRAHVITPWHIELDSQQESSAVAPIGTTRRGIGPTYAEKAARTGLRLGTLITPGGLDGWCKVMEAGAPAFEASLQRDSQAWNELKLAAEELAPFVNDTEKLIRQAARSGQTLLLEGAQGTLLDLDHGTYPFVTSSGTGAGGACQSIGLSPKLVGEIVGIAKAYVTRVGEGPFPTELNCSAGQKMAKQGNEFGATTGRPRRCGWLDTVALRYVVDVNGLDHIILNKLDILTGFEQLKIAVAYEHPDLGLIRDFPSEPQVLAQCQPVYETYSGWTEPVPTAGKFGDLPNNAQRFVEAVEEHGKVAVKMIGTGPGPKDAITRT